MPPERTLDRDQALAELARRYFTSHGPATTADFTWWSGLSAADARTALASARSHLHRTAIDGHDYWHGATPASAQKPARRSARALLLPPYDEYTVAYRDRSAALDPAHAAASRNGIFAPTIVLDGRIAGLWTRRLTTKGVAIAVQPFTPPTGPQARRIAAEAARYGRFIDPPARVR